MASEAQDTFAGYFLRALDARAAMMQDSFTAQDGALRLFNGFLEGYPDLVIDRYARTALIFNYAEDAQSAQPVIELARHLLLERIPWLQAILLKTRAATGAADTVEEARRGVLIHGGTVSRKVREHGVWYALDLTMNMDASLYLDTRGLRAWANQNLAGKRVLNTFAYTGSLGAAAAAGGARQVVQVDLNRRFLNLAKDSFTLNGLLVQRSNFLAGDFWVQVNQFKRAGALFDCVFVDPPFFSSTERGTVDLVTQSVRVLNKVRPLVGHGGVLVAINNALFLPGGEYLRLLEELCSDGYLSIEGFIPVPPDCAGFPETRAGSPPVDPAPFNHSTKIAILRVRRKDERVPQGNPSPG